MEWLEFDDLVDINLRETTATGEPFEIISQANLEMALVRPQNKHFYEGVEDPVLLGAELCYGVVKAHGFLQGNKRAGLYAMALFLRLNGYRLKREDQIGAGVTEKLVIALVTDEMTAAQFADAIRPHIGQTSR